MNYNFQKTLRILRGGGQIFGLSLTSLAVLSWTATPPVLAAEVIGARIGRHPDVTRLVLDLDGRAPYAIRYLDGYRIEVTLGSDDRVSAASLARVTGAGLISAIKSGDHGLIITLKGPAKVARAFALTPETRADAPYRIVLDLAAVSGDAWARLRGPDAALGNVGAATPATVESLEPPPAITPTEPSQPTTGSEPAAASSAPDTPPTLEPLASSESLFDGLSLNGYAEVEGRFFMNASREPGPKDGAASIAVEPTLSYGWNDGRTLIAITPFARVDANDHARSHWDMREAKLVVATGRWELRAGIDKQFWGVVESQHLVDILNQDDALEDVDGEDKLGQLMGSVAYESGFGTFTGYVMSGFRERRFAGREGRPRGPLPIAYDLTQYEAGSDRWHVDWAARWSHVMGPIDIALSYFSGTNRDPLMILGQTAAGAPVLIPRYTLIDQAGLEVQGTFGPLLVKAEAIHRSQPGENYSAAIGGFEYTLFNVMGASDLGILAEYLWDERRHPVDNPFDNDVFVALRWTANDVANSTLLVGSIFDLASRQKFVTIEGSRRIGDDWTIALEGRLFLSVPSSSPLYLYSDDDFLQLKLQRHF